MSKETDKKEGTRKEKVLRLKYITEGNGQGEGLRVSLLSKDQEGVGVGGGQWRRELDCWEIVAGTKGRNQTRELEGEVE